MNESKTLQTDFTSPAITERESTPQEKNLWKQLTDAETLQDVVSCWLILQCQQIDQVYVGLILLNQKDEKFVPVASYPDKFDHPQRFAAVIEKSLHENKGVMLKHESSTQSQYPNTSRYHVAFPIQHKQQIFGCVALEIKVRPQAQLQLVMKQLRWGLAWLENKILQQQTQALTQKQEQVITAMDVTAVALQEDQFVPAATAFVTELATKLDCDRVSIGILKNKKTQIIALSHTATYKKDMNLMRAISEAMDECLDQKITLVYPNESSQNPPILQAHKKMALQQGNYSVCSIPIANHQQQPIGAITLERSAENPFTSETVELCECVAALVGPVLLEKKRGSQPLLAHIANSTKMQLSKLLGRGHLKRKFIALCVLILIIFFTFTTSDFKVGAPSTIEGSIQRAVVAPYNGYVYQAIARPGDILNQGDPLCQLDDRDLSLERLSWLSQREQHERQLRDAMARGNRAGMNILNEQINQANAQISLLDEQIKRATILAPFDGVVVSGDLTQSLGAPVERGEVLFEMAPLNSYRVILKVQESHINYIELGQSGNLVLTALPNQSLPIEVTKITPVSTSEQGKTYFRVEANLNDLPNELRPGMEGYSKVFIDERKLIWIMTYDMVNWFRLWFWSRIP